MNGIGVIPVFVAVVEGGSFASGARSLGVSKSAVSKRITQLEAQLGARLLNRSTRKLSLTEAGERYLAHAMQALASAREAEDAVLELQGDPKGRLKINTPMTFGHLHVAPRIPDFLRRYPNIAIDMIMDDRVVDLIGGGFDLAIRGGTLPDSPLVARRLARCRNVLCAAPGYLQDHGTPGDPYDLLNHNCLHYAYFSDAHEWTFVGPDGPVKIETNGNFQVNNGEALMEVLLGGGGIGRLPSFTASANLASGRLVEVLDNYRMPEQTMYAVFPEKRHLPLKVRVFIDFLVGEFGEDHPYWDRY